MLLAAATLRFWSAGLDPFLNLWDEQFHALVARNMADNNDFFHPVLYRNPLLPYEAGNWTANHTWLHKPPLFLWLMGVCVKIFGASPFVIRIPSVVLSAFGVLALYRMGLLLYTRRVGYLAALLLTVFHLHINVVSGFLNTDQNDAVFAAFVLFSFWAFTEYQFSNSKRWFVATSFFAACAVLTKWLPGLMVYGVWACTILLNEEKRKVKKEYVKLSLSSFIAIVLAAPWFVYAAINWPEEMKAALNNYSSHFSPDASHTGAWHYHFTNVIEFFGLFNTALIAAALFFLPFIKVNRTIWGAFIIITIVVFVFYSFVRTRMPLFTFPVYPLLILFVSALLIQSSDVIRKKMPLRIFQGISSLLLCILLLFFFNPDKIEGVHTPKAYHNPYRKTRIINALIFQKMASRISANAVIFNCANAVNCMFYTGAMAYDSIPDEATLKLIQQKGYEVYIVNEGEVPYNVKLLKGVHLLNVHPIRNGF